MRSKLLLIVSFIQLSLFSVAQTFTIGTNNGANTSTTYPSPYNNRNGFMRTQILVLASELTAAGATAGDITSAAFSVASINAPGTRNNLTGYSLKIKLTTATSLTTTFDNSGFTTVYSPISYTPTTGWNTHAFNNCFAWDGTSNVLIDVCYTAITAATTGATTNWTTGMSFNSTIYATAGGCGVATGTASTNRPIMQFTIQKKDAAAISSNLIGTNIILNQFSPISITIQNNSCKAINSAQVGYKFNGALPVIETFNGPLASGASATYTFTTPVNPITLGFANLKLWVSTPDGIYPDQTPSNDTLRVTNCFVINDPAATNTSYTGTDFWLGFMKNNDNGVANPLYQMIYLSTSAGTTNVTVSIPGLLPIFSTTVSVTSNAITAVQIPNAIAGIALATSTANTISNTGIHLQGSNSVPFTAYGLSREKFTADGYLAMPTTAMGKDYIATAPLAMSSGTSGYGRAEILIISTTNGTTATVTLPAGVKVVGRAAGTTSFTTPVLNAGQTYLIQSDETSVTSGGIFGTTTYTVYDLTGTRITANNNIAILQGNTCANIGYKSGGVVSPTGAAANICGYCDHISEMAIPVLSWGKKYYLTNLADKTGGSIVRVVNYGPGTTTYSLTGQPTQTLTGTGTYKDYMVNNSIAISADKPIYILEMCTGAACDNAANNTDPMIMNILPREQWGNAYSFICPTSATQAFTEHYVNILKQGTGKVALDGIFLPNGAFPGSFTQIGTTGIYAGTFTLPSAGGFHTLIGDSAISAYVYGFTTDDSYGYPASGASLAPVALPIELLSFNGKKANKDIELSWTTASEINNDYYTLERSGDGIIFEPIATVKSQHKVNVGTYNYIDNKPLNGKNYYRLRQTDINGNSTLTKIVLINVVNSIETVSIKPIPAKEKITVSVTYNATESGELKVFSITGQLLLQRNVQLMNGTIDSELDIKDLENGVYFLSIETPQEKIQKKIVKY